MKTQLTGLAGTMAELKERVRVAVAGELGRAVGDAVRQVVQAVVAGNTKPSAAPRTAASRWDEDDEDDRDGWGRPRDPWAEGPAEDDDDYGRGARRTAPKRHETPSDEPPTAVNAGVTAAVAAGVYVARWWLVRRGTLLAAAGLGLGVGLLGVIGGPLARTAVAVLAATADVLTATDALGDGAAHLAHV
jgi:hypothetical protein